MLLDLVHHADAVDVHQLQGVVAFRISLKLQTSECRDRLTVAAIVCY